MTPEERFGRIEKKHEELIDHEQRQNKKMAELADLVGRIAHAQDKNQDKFAQLIDHAQDQDKKMGELRELVARIGQGHVELEAAQLNQQKVHARLEEIVADVAERLANLTILVDTLIKRDMH
jgi:hypothetical protein